MAAQGIAFAPTVTPGTYNDPPSLVHEHAFAADSPLLFPANPDADGSAATAAMLGSAPVAPGARRAAHAKKRPENHIPRPPNAFILFRSSFIKNQHVSSEVETNHSTLSKIIGLTWQNLPNEERQVWHAKAKAALEEHKRKFPQYAFRPLHTKGKAPAEKRKVREVEPKDLTRCAKIAELLIEGKKGAALDAAIQEFDRHHVPQVVTRFEAPITARHYRRSSSAPVPETEHSAPGPFLSAAEPASPAQRKLKGRSSSSQPEAPRASSPVSEASSFGCPTPAPSSPPESEPDTESDCYSSPPPSSPFAPTPTYALAPQNPSFVSAIPVRDLHRSAPLTRDLSAPQDFSTFSFDTSATPALPPYAPACDPLAPHDVFHAYTQESTNPCVPAPAHDMYAAPHSLSIDTSSFILDWTTPPASASPLSSVPGTPQTYPVSAAVLDGACYLDDVLDPAADYLAPHPYQHHQQHPHHHHHQHQQQDTHLYQQHAAAYGVGLTMYGTAPAQQQHRQPDYGAAAQKGSDFSAYFAPHRALDPVDAGFASQPPPPYMSPLSAFAI